MFFRSIKETNRLLKEVNRLLINGMPNIFFRVTIDKKGRIQNFHVLSLKSLSHGERQLMKISNFQTFLLQLKNKGYGRKTVFGFSIFILKGIMMF